MDKVNVNLIRAFEGPLHSRLEAGWKTYAARHATEMNLHVFENRIQNDYQSPHDVALQAVWKTELARPERFAIITEFDFLPHPTLFMAMPRQEDRPPILVAKYCTRDPQGRLVQHPNLVGPWFMWFDKKRAPRHLDFRANGPFNDPAALLTDPSEIRFAVGTDLYPRSHGVYYPLIGTHLFYSRHYNDPDVPGATVGHFRLSDILVGVRSEIARWESTLA